jgi:hypothetical protein
VGDALRHRPRGEPPRLGVADGAADAAAQLEADLRELGRLARAGLARHDDDLVLGDRRAQVVPPGADRQLGRIGDLGDRGPAALDALERPLDLRLDALARLRLRVPAQAVDAPTEAVRVAERQVVQAAAQDLGVGGGGHPTDDRRDGCHLARLARVRHHGGMTADPSGGTPRRLDPWERRRLPRVQLAVECTLQRRMGSPIAAQTIDLGPGGMRVESRRPLSADEELEFAIPSDILKVSGRARVMRQQERHVYALRFERLPPEARAALNALAARTPPTSLL